MQKKACVKKDLADKRNRKMAFFCPSGEVFAAINGLQNDLEIGLATFGNAFLLIHLRMCHVIHLAFAYFEVFLDFSSYNVQTLVIPY